MKKEASLIVSGLSFIAFVVLLSLLLADQFTTNECTDYCPHVVSQNFIIIFVLLAMVFVGSLGYYLATLKIETRDRDIKKNINLVLTFLDADERKVLKDIISSGGQILQSKLTHEFGKLQTHRIVQRLKNKNIIHVVRSGKTNRIILKDELRRELVQ